MIPIQLETGKTVFKTFQEWIDMTPQQYQDMIANNEGIDIDNPFERVLDHIKEDRNTWDIPDLPEDVIIEEIKVTGNLLEENEQKTTKKGKNNKKE